MLDATPSALATLDDLEGWLGEDLSSDPAEALRAQWALEAASTLVAEVAGRRGGAWSQDTTPPRAQHIVLSCAARAYTNPEGWQYESVDDWRAGGRPVGDGSPVYLTPSERASILALATPESPRRGVGVIRTTRDDGGAPVADGLLTALWREPR